jgi:hypothetical protein
MMPTTKQRVVFLIIALLLPMLVPAAATAQGGNQTYAVYLPITARSLRIGPMYSVTQRFGVNVATVFEGEPDFPGSITDYAGVENMGIGWYSDWTFREKPARPGNMEYAQLAQTGLWPLDNKERASLRAAAQSNPGSLWIIGNEPETRGQGQLTPEEYATIYHEAYYLLKEADPKAQIAIGGVVMPSPLRLKWLDRCLNYYKATYGEKMPIDVWNIHMQILREEAGGWGCGIPYGLSETKGRLYDIADNWNVDIFKQLLTEFCTWLVERGERDKPLIISEYGTLMPSSYMPNGDQDVLAFMQGTFDYMLDARDPVLGYADDEGRLVQRWLWFSLNFPSYDESPGGFNGALYHWDQPDQLTVFGEFYRDYVQQRTRY